MMRYSLSFSLLLILILINAAMTPGATSESIPTTMSMTGQAVPDMGSYDRIIPALMQKWQIPGGSVAVVKDGRLVLARGYGLADKEAQQPVQPDSLFRTGSLSKCITAAAVLKLVEQGKLSLEAKAFELLSNLKPPDNATVDERIYQITVRQLLQHTGGWDREKTFDPVNLSRLAARVVGVPGPASPETLIRFIMGQPLQNDPGTHYAYSNIGYIMLGCIVEKVSGRSYSDYVQEAVLKPAGIYNMRAGQTRLSARAPGEVHYYDYPGAPPARSVFPGEEDPVPAPYGSLYLESLYASGAWTASAIDLMRFLTAIDGRDTRPDILKLSTVNIMIAPPAVPTTQNASFYYAMGWQVRSVRGDTNWWHGGEMPGTRTYMMRGYNGISFVVLFNSKPRDRDKAVFTEELENALFQAAREVKKWPTHDLFI